MEKKEITEKKIKTRIGEIQEENEKIKRFGLQVQA